MQSTKPTILMLGIKNSGKTKFVESLCGHSDAFVMPTPRCAHQDYSRFLIKDFSGDDCFRHCRENNYPSADSFIFVISLLDFHDRIDEVKQALIEASTSTGIKPFTIVINMRDSPSYDVAARGEEVRQNVKTWLACLYNCPYMILLRYKILSYDVKEEADVKDCFDQIVQSI